MAKLESVEEEKNLDACTHNSDARQKALLVALAAAVLAILGLGWYIFDSSRGKSAEDVSLQGQQEQEEPVLDTQVKKNGTLNLSNTDPEVGGIVEKVSKHILLPTGQITVATVNDANALRLQFPGTFQYVKNGDRLLISSESVIMYDPLIDKVVDVAH